MDNFTVNGTTITNNGTTVPDDTVTLDRQRHHQRRDAHQLRHAGIDRTGAAAAMSRSPTPSLIQVDDGQCSRCPAPDHRRHHQQLQHVKTTAAIDVTGDSQIDGGAEAEQRLCDGRKRRDADAGQCHGERCTNTDNGTSAGRHGDAGWRRHHQHGSITNNGTLEVDRSQRRSSMTRWPIPSHHPGRPRPDADAVRPEIIGGTINNFNNEAAARSTSPATARSTAARS